MDVGGHFSDALELVTMARCERVLLLMERSNQRLLIRVKGEWSSLDEVFEIKDRKIGSKKLSAEYRVFPLSSVQFL